jgi:hypothetical protein
MLRRSYAGEGVIGGQRRSYHVEHHIMALAHNDQLAGLGQTGHGPYRQSHDHTPAFAVTHIAGTTDPSKSPGQTASCV